MDLNMVGISNSATEDDFHTAAATAKKRKLARSLSNLDSEDDIASYALATRKTKLDSQFAESDTLVTINVGPDQVNSSNPRKTYHLHKVLLCQYSSFFTAAFNSSFIEGQTRTMILEDVDYRVFDLLVYWLYNTNIFEAPDRTLGNLAGLWVLAERFLMAELQQETLILIRDWFPRIPNQEALSVIHVAYTIDKDNDLKAALVEKLVASADEEFENWMENIPRDMVKDVAKHLRQRCQRFEENNRKPEQNLRDDVDTFIGSGPNLFVSRRW